MIREFDSNVTPIFRCSHVELDSMVVVVADQILRYILEGSRLESTFKSLRTDYELESSWTATPVIIFRDYEEPYRNYGWNEVLAHIKLVLTYIDTENWYLAQRGLLAGMGVSEIAGFDGEPLLIIDEAAKCNSFETAREVIYDTAVDLLQIQIAKKGPTHFLDVDKMRGTSACKLIL